MGSTMPWRLRNDQVLHQQDDDERRAEEDRHLRELDVGRLADDGDAAEVDVHVRVALAVDDLVQALVERDEVRRLLVLLEVGDHRRRPAVGRDQRVDVDGHRRHRRFQARDVFGRARHRLHHRPHFHAVGAALHVLHLARGEAQDVVADRVRQQLELVLDALDLGQDLRLIDVALLRQDANHREIAAAEELLELVGRLDVGVLLRGPQVGIRVHLQAAEPGREKGGDQQNGPHHQEAARDDPPRVRAKNPRIWSFHL